METKQKKQSAPASVKRRSGTKTASAKAAPRSQRPSGAAVKRTTRSTSPAKRTVAAKTPVKKTERPDVVYTPPKPFTRGRILLRLAIIVAVVAALMLGLSVFFKVENITVSGNEKYTAWDIASASGIQQGDNLFSFGEQKAVSNIHAELPYVDDVRIGIQLPDTVNIWVEELDVVYAIRDSYESWWLFTSDGKVVEQVTSAVAGEYTKVQGVALADPQPNGTVVAAEEPEPTDRTEPDSTEITLETTAPVVVRGSDRLSAALSILQYLEQYGMIGTVTSVDVSDLGSIELWYGQQFQVNLGDTTELSYKISCMKQTIDGLKDYDTGSIDVSFTIMDVPIYKSFT